MLSNNIFNPGGLVLVIITSALLVVIEVSLQQFLTDLVFSESWKVSFS